jgi:outer membrane receptor protein involved in Fe transport
MSTSAYHIFTRLIRVAVLAPLLLLGRPFPAVGQAVQQPGAVAGAVTDARGQPIAGAQVLIEETGQGANTGPNGQFLIRNVQPGTYTLTVTGIGYRGQSSTVTVRAGQTSAGLRFALAIDPLELEGVVVTATRTPREKLESSTAVTTISAAAVEQDAPASTADLMKQVPGFYAEASGGEVNNNLFVRGLPADGSYRYVVFMEDGMPANDANDLFFLGADNFVRVDENIDRVEAVRGGNSALFGSNSAGGVVNLISKTGGPALAGTFKAQAGTRGFTRYDANVNGPMGDDWRFNIGGYYRFDDGVRDPGFPAARGGQIKANVTRLFDAGYVTVYGKYINDKNIFYLPLPLQPGKLDGDVVKLESDFVSGFPSDGTMTSRSATFLKIPLPSNNGELTLPLQDGIAQTGGTLMVDVAIALDNGWNLRNTGRAMNLDHQWNALLPFEIVDADSYVAGQLAATGGANAALAYADDGSTFGTPNNLLSLGGLWHVEKPVTNFSNQLLLSKEYESAGGLINSITIGGYFGHYTADNRWFFNDVLTEVADQPRLVDLTITDAAGGIVSATQNGFRAYLPFYVNAFGNATLFSIFAGDEIQVTERLRLDIGARYEHDEYEQNVENTAKFDLGDTLTTADDAELFGTRSYQRVDVTFDEWAASIGINYALNGQTSLYARGSRGYKMPLLDQFLFATDPEAEGFPDEAETLWQVEAGVKLSSQYLGLSAVAYWLQLADFPSQDARVVNGETVFVTDFVGKARTFGAEVEAVVAPVEGGRLFTQVTLQDHQYVDFVAGGKDLSGKWVRRIPQLIFMLGGAYTSSGFSVRADWRYTGKRFSNNENSIELPGFGVVGARAGYYIPGQGVELWVAAQNLLDGKGLTEGNPRLDEQGIPSGPALARPILPQRFIFGLTYRL